MLALCIVLLIGYFRLVQHGERYQTITGKDFRPRRIDLGAWRYRRQRLLLPDRVLHHGHSADRDALRLASSLLPGPGVAAFKSMTLENYTSLLHGDEIWHTR